MHKYSDLKKHYHFAEMGHSATQVSAAHGDFSPPFTREEVYAPHARGATDLYTGADGGERGETRTHFLKYSSYQVIYIILFVICSVSFLYVRDEALNNPSSVFHEFYEVFKGRFGELSLSFLIFPKEKVSTEEIALMGAGPTILESAIENISGESHNPSTTSQELVETADGILSEGRASIQTKEVLTGRNIPLAGEREKLVPISGDSGTPAALSVVASKLGETPADVLRAPSGATSLQEVNVEAVQNAENPTSPTSLVEKSEALATARPKETTRVFVEQELASIPIFLPKLKEDKSSILFTRGEHSLAKPIVMRNILEDYKSLGAFYGSLLKEVITIDYNASGSLDFFPNNIKIYKVWIENETLMINVSRSFEYSRYGRKGMEARLQLILWTIFSITPILEEAKQLAQPVFVSLLIEGKRKSKIGGDGLPLSPFYSINDLKTTLAFIDS